MTAPRSVPFLGDAGLKLLYGLLLPGVSATALLFVSPRINGSWLSGEAFARPHRKVRPCCIWISHFAILSDRRWMMRWLPPPGG